ncbi:vanadium-dependent haloperoxidase [Posidoniimonas corsicana]|uniref:vanadium-dependent haloperoxidase n=1 Tax=Posidoniimonas corsicana TaxID=1938618 RepID=UPI0011B82318|nr:vanadium-dependent haloperoxidase [Posidoniimonas corsicana]
MARIWNEQLLHAISIDTARPTVHARNLFHVSAAMFDAWSAYDPAGHQYFGAVKAAAADTEAARAEAISYAAYNVLLHRFVTGPGGLGPGRSATVVNIRDQMTALGYDPDFTSQAGDSPAAVGNRIAQAVIDHGLADGANEANRYANPAGMYLPVNPPLTVEDVGVAMDDPNRWQPLNFRGDRIDQFGNTILPSTQTNLTPYWGAVTPFSLTPADRGPGGVYFDQGAPPRLGGAGDQAFKANAVAMIRYSSQLDPGDGVVIDISPASRGNTFDAPLTESYAQAGYAANPVTGLPYQPQLVRRGDFGRVMAEFWADGPHSTAPPGHWNEIRNDITDQMELLGVPKQMGGAGPTLTDVEWDVKSMFALNGGLHDAAIAAWNHKGHYDTSRPISFIRYMGSLGQSSDPGGPSYHPDGLPLEPGLIEVVTGETTAAGGRHEGLAGHEGAIVVRAWRGPVEGTAPFDNPADLSGVGWILAEEWLPYQLSSFVTPPFPGYVSGHSTFSRVGAELMTQLTGSPYVPGGLFEYEIPIGAGLNFEYGPIESLRIQFASYFDAADMAAESRLWGGIHPAQDDFTGRRIGQLVGAAAWERAASYFGVPVPEPASVTLLAFAASLVWRRHRSS